MNKECKGCDKLPTCKGKWFDPKYEHCHFYVKTTKE